MGEFLYKIPIPLLSAAAGGYAVNNALTGNVNAAGLEAALSIASGLFSIYIFSFDSKK